MEITDQARRGEESEGSNMYHLKYNSNLKVPYYAKFTLEWFSNNNMHPQPVYKLPQDEKILSSPSLACSTFHKMFAQTLELSPFMTS